MLPLFLYAVPVDNIYNGESICIIKSLFGVECWGCGTTRAVFSVLYGKFSQAWEYNRMIVVIFPLLLWLWVSEIHRTICKMRAKK